tara:strand:- start:18777 stop:19871 length:1095 start_codon:yes stop_codon:yes gene_type:complete
MEKKLDLDILKIVKFLKSQIQSLEAIFLVGSFGRNEGSVLNHHEKSICINDYDLVVLSNKNLESSFINGLRKKLENILQIRHVDISSYQKRDFKKMDFTMYSYDLKYASKTIFGNEKYLNLIPDMDKSKMPILEAIRPLLLFPGALLLAYPKKKQMTKIEIFWSYQQISKSILGWSSAMLIEKGLYTPSYLERSKIFEKRFSNRKRLCELVKEATNFKLRPNLKPIESEDLMNIWVEATKAHLEVSEFILKNAFSPKSQNIEDALTHYEKSFRNRLKWIFSFITGTDKTSIVNIEIGQLFLLKSLVNQEKLGVGRYSLLAIERKKRLLEIAKKTISTDTDLIDLFINLNPNTRDWNKKSNKLLY